MSDRHQGIELYTGKRYILQKNLERYLFSLPKIATLKSINISSRESEKPGYLVFKPEGENDFTISILDIISKDILIKRVPWDSELQEVLVAKENISDFLLDCLLSLDMESKAAIWQCLTDKGVD